MAPRNKKTMDKANPAPTVNFKECKSAFLILQEKKQT